MTMKMKEKWLKKNVLKRSKERRDEIHMSLMTRFLNSLHFRYIFFFTFTIFEYQKIFIVVRKLHTKCLVVLV
jgi:hypothetical protein